MDTATVTAISKYIRDNIDTPFEWGVFDCCVFSSKIIELQTGIDLYSPYSGKYKTERGAALAQKKYGSIEDNLDKHFKRIVPSLAQRGDIHMMANGVMAVQFGGSILGTTEHGIRQLHEETNICWRVE